jgi:hypothetical protein
MAFVLALLGGCSCWLCVACTVLVVVVGAIFYLNTKLTTYALEKKVPDSQSVL